MRREGWKACATKVFDSSCARGARRDRLGESVSATSMSSRTEVRLGSFESASLDSSYASDGKPMRPEFRSHCTKFVLST